MTPSPQSLFLLVKLKMRSQVGFSLPGGPENNGPLKGDIPPVAAPLSPLPGGLQSWPYLPEAAQLNPSFSLRGSCDLLPGKAQEYVLKNSFILLQKTGNGVLGGCLLPRAGQDTWLGHRRTGQQAVLQYLKNGFKHSPCYPSLYKIVLRDHLVPPLNRLYLSPQPVAV